MQRRKKLIAFEIQHKNIAQTLNHHSLLFQRRKYTRYAQTLIEKRKEFDADVEFEYVLVDDGSKDRTYDAILAFHKEYPIK